MTNGIHLNLTEWKPVPDIFPVRTTVRIDRGQEDRILANRKLRKKISKKKTGKKLLLNHAAPRTQEQRSTIVDALTRTYTHLPLCHGHTLFIVTDTHQHIDRDLYTCMTSYLAQTYRLSILIDKPTLFINSLLIRL